MNFLVLVLKQTLSVHSLHTQPSDHFVVNGERFFRRKTKDEEAVFYDWLADRTGVIQALEIHLPADHPLVRGRPPVASLEYVTINPFLCIWFGRTREALPLGKEAFGDLFFFHNENHNLGVVVGTRDWLSDKERELLCKNINICT
jgi:hypothetical protein